MSSTTSNWEGDYKLDTLYLVFFTEVGMKNKQARPDQTTFDMDSCKMKRRSDVH